MAVIPTSLFGEVVHAAHYLVRGRRIRSQRLVFDATAANAMRPA